MSRDGAIVNGAGTAKKRLNLTLGQAVARGMTEILDIAAVARATGLTSRALRFYEARGLIAPLRTASGRRLFGPAELARLHELLALKRAGLSLAQIKTLFDGRPIDLGALLRAQVAAIDAQAQELAQARSHLEIALSRIDRGEPLDAATLCSLIRSGESMTMQEEWKAVSGRYISAQAEADFAETMPRMPADFDQAAYSAQWADLTARIEAALPLDPAGAAAGRACTIMSTSGRTNGSRPSPRKCGTSSAASARRGKCNKLLLGRWRLARSSGPPDIAGADRAPLATWISSPLIQVAMSDRIGCARCRFCGNSPLFLPQETAPGSLEPHL